MVEYSTWVSLCRVVASRKGADLSKFELNSDLVSVAAEIWRERDDLEDATERQARAIAEEEIEV